MTTKYEIYLAGIKDGIRRFAWWKDGVEYVGTCGTTLKKALEKVEAEIASHPPGWRANIFSIENPVEGGG